MPSSRPAAGIAVAPVDFEMAIGEVSEALGLTQRAIRYYEQVGLISTRRERTNRHLIGAGGRQRLAMIGDLRRAGIALHEIKRILDAPSVGLLLETLIARHAVLSQELGRVERLRQTCQGAAPEAPRQTAQSR